MDNQPRIPSYAFSKIRDAELEGLVQIEKVIDKGKFDSWFADTSPISSDIDDFLHALILDNEDLIYDYNEEDLKIYFIAPLLNKINFKVPELNIRGFYEHKIVYQTEAFILSGTTDFVVSEGLLKSKKPYFFLQEFKRAEDFSNPRPQLLAELLSAVELNDWQHIKGVYVIGSQWFFVMLEKLGVNQYQYVVSKAYDCINIIELRLIYQYLSFVKQEIIAKISA